MRFVLHIIYLPLIMCNHDIIANDAHNKSIRSIDANSKYNDQPFRVNLTCKHQLIIIINLIAMCNGQWAQLKFVYSRFFSLTLTELMLGLCVSHIYTVYSLFFRSLNITRKYEKIIYIIFAVSFSFGHRSEIFIEICRVCGLVYCKCTYCLRGLDTAQTVYNVYNYSMCVLYRAYIRASDRVASHQYLR